MQSRHGPFANRVRSMCQPLRALTGSHNVALCLAPLHACQASLQTRRARPEQIIQHKHSTMTVSLSSAFCCRLTCKLHPGCGQVALDLPKICQNSTAILYSGCWRSIFNSYSECLIFIFNLYPICNLFKGKYTGRMPDGCQRCWRDLIFRC